MTGIFIGIAAVVALISLGQGLEASITEQFTRLGTDKVIVSPVALDGGPPGISIRKLNEHDKEILANVRGVEEVAPITMRLVSVNFNGRTKFISAHGLTTNEKEKKLSYEVQAIEIERGEDLKEDNEKNILIGYELATDDALFGKALKIGDKVLVEGRDFGVVGILKKRGNPIEDRHIYFTLSVDKELSGEKEKFDFIFVQAAKSVSSSNLAERIKQEMRKDRHQKNGEEDFSVETLENISNTFGKVLLIIQAVLVGIAAISLLVGGIGIANTMYTSVLERTKEIGTMKAIGAKNSDILMLFLIESGMIGLIGGLIGVIMGIGLSKTTEYIATSQLGSELLKASTSPALIIGALVFSFLMGACSGVLPALQASKLKPVDALRYE